MSYTPYRDFDLFTHKCGVNPIIMGYLFQFKPWYYDGKRVYEGKYYELRSDAEKAAEDLKKFYINRARFLEAVREKPHLCLLQTALIDILLRGLVFFLCISNADFTASSGPIINFEFDSRPAVKIVIANSCGLEVNPLSDLPLSVKDETRKSICSKYGFGLFFSGI
mgnify:CR=1 FL=1